jgi:hypothetical protein
LLCSSTALALPAAALAAFAVFSVLSVPFGPMLIHHAVPIFAEPGPAADPEEPEYCQGIWGNMKYFLAPGLTRYKSLQIF